MAIELYTESKDMFNQNPCQAKQPLQEDMRCWGLITFRSKLRTDACRQYYIWLIAVWFLLIVARQPIKLLNLIIPKPNIKPQIGKMHSPLFEQKQRKNRECNHNIK